jgi:hypothetical protein
MPYPVIGKAEARSYLTSFDVAAEAGEETPSLPEARQNDAGPEEDWESIGAEIFATLDKVRTAAEKKGASAGSEFESAAGPALHTVLPDHAALADPEFWIWMAVVPCQAVVRWRYSDKGNARNFGVGGAGENFLYRLWLRAEIGHSDQGKDVYALAKVGDIDFWRSHIFRQGYGDVRHFARALIRFQFPEKKGGKPRLKIDEIRELAKQLKRARSNLMFELMSQERATQFIESEWERLASKAT